MKLTARDVELLDCLASGMNNKAIAVHMGTATHTVKLRMKVIILKLWVPETAHPRIWLAVNWSYPLFREGCKALGLL